MAYIDKSRAIGMLERFREEHSNLPNACLKMIDVALNIIKQIPTADVVEVVRCENCTHGKQYSNVVVCHKFGRDTKEDFFCGYGERKEKNDFKE